MPSHNVEWQEGAAAELGETAFFPESHWETTYKETQFHGVALLGKERQVKCCHGP